MSSSNVTYLKSPSVTLAASGSSSRVALPIKSSLLRVVNYGSAVAFLNTGDVNVTAALNTNICIAPGATETFRIDPTDTYIAAISSGTNLSISNVEGV